jgi:CRISPR-associated endonuclease/helicase Cas3
VAIAHSVNALAAQESGQNNVGRYLAHVRQDGEAFIPHDLDEHLRGVARRAEECARDFSGGDWAKVAGLWHDLGKYSAEF